MKHLVAQSTASTLPGPSAVDADAVNSVAEAQGGALSLTEPSATRGRLWTQGSRVMQVVSGFLLGQGAVQAINMLGGLLLVHMMSVESYAQVGLVTGFQTVAASLMDLGFAGTIIPMVGAHRDDHALVGRYVAAAKRLRDRSFVIVAPLALLALVAIMRKHHWSWQVEVLLSASVALSLYSGGPVSYFSAPLLLNGRLREYYVPQVVLGAARLVLLLALLFAGELNAWTAAGLAALCVTGTGMAYKRRSRNYMDWSEEPRMAAGRERERATEREIVRYILPAAPALIVWAFQPQLSLLAISIFGGAEQMAQVAALGRLGVFFSILMTFNVIVLEPYLARRTREQMPMTYVLLVAVALVGTTPLTLLAFAHPQVYLWVLGSKYAALSREMGWFVLASCTQYLAGLLWIINRSRKWLYWSGTALEVGLLLCVQIGFLAFIGIRTVHEAMLFMFTASFCPILAHLYVAAIGFTKGERNTAEPAV